GYINEWQWRFTQSAVFGRTSHTNDLPVRGVGADAQSFADRVLRRKIASRQLLVDNHHARTAFAIHRIEVAPLRHGNAHRVEIVEADHIAVEFQIFIGPGFIAFDLNATPRSAAGDRNNGGQGG